jgi:hypothetical protein
VPVDPAHRPAVEVGQGDGVTDRKSRCFDEGPELGDGNWIASDPELRRCRQRVVDLVGVTFTPVICDTRASSCRRVPIMNPGSAAMRTKPSLSSAGRWKRSRSKRGIAELRQPVTGAGADDRL